jgi:hypothetical protein
LLEEHDWCGYTYKTARCKMGLRVFYCTQKGETLATAKGA